MKCIIPPERRGYDMRRGGENENMECRRGSRGTSCMECISGWEGWYLWSLGGAEGDGRGMDGWMDGGEAKVYLVILIFLGGRG
jgi:hypothetical protein